MSSTIERELEAVELEDAVVDTANDTEPPATPETVPPVTETPDDGSVPQEGDTVIGGVRVDRFGRMHRADGTVMSKAEQDAARAASPAPVAAAAPVDAPKNEPYVPVAYGQPMADVFPGALKSPKGDLYFPAATASRVEQLVARGMRYDEFRRQSATAKAELDRITKRTAAEAEALQSTLLAHVATPEALQALAARVQEVGPALAHLELKLAIQNADQTLNRDFGHPAKPTAAEHSTPLDRDDAGETFEGYWRDMVALPELHGMSAELQQHVRQLLANVPLFTQDRQTGEWWLNEAAADPVWAMAKTAMARERSIASATSTNAARRPNSTVPSRIPPSAASPSPVGTGVTPTRKKAPREFADPFDAIRYADLSGE